MTFCGFHTDGLYRYQLEMSFATNSNLSQRQKREKGIVEVVPPYTNEIESFDNPDKYPDLEFVVGAEAKPLQLHRKIIADTSGWIKGKLNGTWGQKLEWPFDTSKEVDKETLIKALRFCYGETLSVGIKNGECCAMIAALTRLQVTCLYDAVMSLMEFAVEEAKRDIKADVELLKVCVGYKECCESSGVALDKKLAAIVLTKENMKNHFKEVVDECLMMLPPDYLMVAEYGEPHTKYSVSQ